METVRPATVPQSSSSSASSTTTVRSGLLRSVAAKLARARKSPAASDAKGYHQQQQQHNPEYVDAYTVSSMLSRTDDKVHNLKAMQLQQKLVVHTSDRVDHRGRKDTDLLLASIFACVSAIKAAYAQIQIAQNPYDPATIQTADATVVQELRRVSELKQGYYQASHHQLLIQDDAATSSKLEAEIRENTNLLKAYQITSNKLQSDLQTKDQHLAHLNDSLRKIENNNRALDRRLRHRHNPPPSSSSTSSPSSTSGSPSPPLPSPTTTTLPNLQGLHLSGLDPTHFLLALRYALRAVRHFVQVLVREMESAGWDLTAASAAIAPCAVTPEAGDLAFQSYVCLAIFNDFHLGPGFRPLPSADNNASSVDRRRRSCFDEFSAARSCDSAKDLARLRRPFADFCRAKYAAIVNPKMESAFFAGMDRRDMAHADVFVTFAEMARRVWILHWLFFSFDPQAVVHIFRAQPGMRFSEVYMAAVGTAHSPTDRGATVGFTVVPGFRIRGTVIQCKVYLTPPDSFIAP